MTEEKTIFQKIIDREIPATIIYEDEENIAYMYSRNLLKAPKRAAFHCSHRQQLFLNYLPYP